MGNIPDDMAEGVILLQGFLQYFCQGIVFMQAAKFWKRSAEDTIYLRAFVALLVVSACLQTVLSTYKVWVVVLHDRHWWTDNLYCTDFLINGLICSICEAFLIRRCWKISQRNRWVLLFLCSLATAAFVANIFLAVKTAKSIGKVPAYMDPLRASDWAFPVWVYVSLALELAITSTLSITLWKSKTGFSYLDKTLRNIIGITWESAALPCICMIVSASLYFIGRTSPDVRHLDMFFILSTAKFYTLGLLRTLNSRVKFREKLRSKDVGRRSLGTWLSKDDTVVGDDEPPTGLVHPSIAHESLEAHSSYLNANSVPSPATRSADDHFGTDMTSPAMDARERGVTVRKVGFMLVN